MRSGGPDRVSLVSGLAIVAAGVALLLDRAGDISLSAGVLGALASALVGVILLISGLGERDDD